MKKGLSITMVFQAESANYGEGIGNISTLKKMSRSDGNMYTYISRQAIRYNIVEQMGIDGTPVSGKKGAMQFTNEAQIDEYPEIDLFGYMKTKKAAKKATKGKKTEEETNDDAGGADTRSAAVRLSNAISLEPYNSDLDFLTNMGLSNRIKSVNVIVQSEIHHSMYSYTLSIDLDRIGVDKSISISKDEKAKRICDLLDTIQFLYRDIKGRRENLAPIFIVGGVYERKSPYFEDRIKMDKFKVDFRGVEEIINSSEDTKNNTLVGVLDGGFANTKEIKSELCATTVTAVFEKLKEEVRGYYD